MYRINSYLLNSGSVNNLTSDPEFKRIRRNSRYPLVEDYIINWGCKTLPTNLIENKEYVWANSPEVTELFSNKALLYNHIKEDEDLSGEFIQMTDSYETALSWLQSGSSVVCRTLVTASNGRGAYVVDPSTENGEELLRVSTAGIPVKLWSLYFKKRSEYRYHGGLLRDGEFFPIAVQEKRKRHSYSGDQRLRNAEGYVFKSRCLCDIPEAVSDTVEFVMRLLSCDFPTLAFAGVDVAYNEHYNKAAIIELNTAPGIGVNDAEAYREFFRLYFSEE